MESKIQRKIILELEKKGWVVVKLIKTTMNGIPDLMALKCGKTVFIEVKTEKGVTSKLQKFRHENLRSQGFAVHVCTCFEEISLFF
jgi:Holliday junction resolvase